MVAEAGAEPVDPAVVLRWARTAADVLADAGDDLDDLMVTSRRAYRLVRPVDGGQHGPLLLQLSLDRSRANLAAARRELALVRIESSIPPPPAVTSPGPLPPLPRRVPSAIPPAAVRGPVAAPGRRPARVPLVGSAAPSGPAVVPAPRGVVTMPAARRETAAPADPAPRWADDVGTMRRLLAGLRALR